MTEFKPYADKNLWQLYYCQLRIQVLFYKYVSCFRIYVYVVSIVS
jgi:hypothetical protein